MIRHAKPYPSKEAAENSAALRAGKGCTDELEAVQCVHICGTGIWHLEPKGKSAATERRPQKDTGPDRKTRGLVLARDGFMCVACGKTVGGACTWWSLQHRLARGSGGRNSPENLIALCGSATSEGCHRKCEDRDEEMHARGYWLNSWEIPAQVPVMYFDQSGCGVSMYLSPDGSLSPDPPVGEVA